MCAVRVLTRCIAQNPSNTLNNADVLLLRETLETIKETPPRRVEALINSMPVIVFTDGACEEDGQVVFYDAWKGIKKFFGQEIPKKTSDTCKRDGKKQLVGQAEMLPVLVSKIIWKIHLYKRRVMWFLDNDAAQATYGSCTSQIDDSLNMLRVSAKVDNVLCAYHWYTRVSSCANVSYPASRLDFASYDDSCCL